MKLGKLLEGIEILEGNWDPELEISGVSYDSRQTKPGDLFLLKQEIGRCAGANVSIDPLCRSRYGRPSTGHRILTLFCGLMIAVRMTKERGAYHEAGEAAGRH